jgi:hypothetical protein
LILLTAYNQACFTNCNLIQTSIGIQTYGDDFLNFLEELNLAIRARCTVLYVQTLEEDRLIADLKDASKSLSPAREIEIWDFATGFEKNSTGKGNPVAALDIIFKTGADSAAIYILKDFLC